jgi:hypothetical protein
VRAPSPFGKELARFRFAEYTIFAWQLGSVFLIKGELVQLGMESENKSVSNAQVFQTV